MRRYQYSLKTLFLVVLLVSVLFAIWRALAYAGFAFPPDGMHVHLDCGSRQLEYVAIVAHEDSGDVGLRPYMWKVYYFTLDRPDVGRSYNGQPIISDCQ